jgi:hypothetical protein
MSTEGKINIIFQIGIPTGIILPISTVNFVINLIEYTLITDKALHTLRDSKPQINILPVMVFQAHVFRCFQARRPALRLREYQAWHQH